MKVKVTMDGDIAVVQPKGSLVGGDETIELEQVIHGLIEKGNKKLIIDLGDVDLLTSRPMGSLVATHTNYVKREGRLKLCRLTRRIKNVFVITKIATIIDVYDSLDEAVASFKG